MRSQQIKASATTITETPIDAFAPAVMLLDAVAVLLDVGVGLGVKGKLAADVNTRAVLACTNDVLPDAVGGGIVPLTPLSGVAGSPTSTEVSESEVATTATNSQYCMVVVKVGNDAET